jgi:hypothetical protein
MTAACGARGFTLLEVLLAATLTALIFAVVASIIAAVMGGTSRVSAAVSEDNSGGEVEDVIADDLAFLTAITDKPPFSMKVGSGNATSFSFYTSAGSKTAWGMVATPIHIVTYEVKPMPSGGKGLYRGEKPLIETADAYYDAPLLLAENVTMFKAEAYDGQKWHNAWPDSGTSPLPALIRVYIDLQTVDGRTKQLYVESAPPVEYGSRPQEERRASGGSDTSVSAPQGGQPNQPDNGQSGGDGGQPSGDQSGGADAPAPEDANQ